MTSKFNASTRRNNVFQSILLLTILFSSLSNAQAINADLINFKTMTVWPDLKGCLQNCFTTFGIQWDLQCTTNACICRPDTLGDAIEKVYVKAFSSCSAIQDQALATSILIDYCSSKGSTSIIKPTTGLPGSSSCVAQFVTVYRNDSYSTQAVILGRSFEVFVAVLFLSIGIATFAL